MLRSFVGIATRNGLETLLPEHAQALRLLKTQAQRHPSGRQLCFWAVLSERVALQVQRHLAAGDAHTALVTLDRNAKQLGPLVPL
jgi:hypothetical protein